MRKIIESEFVTLDGVIEDPGGAEDFKHGGWSFQFGSAEQQQWKVEELFQADALLLGRRSYQGFAAAWPTMPGTGAYGERMNSLPKYVASTTLAEMTWHATLIQADPALNYHRFEPQRGPGGAFVQVGETTGAKIGQMLIYVSTADIDATLAQAEALGAKTLTPKTEVPHGWFAVFADPAGNRIA